MWAGAAVLVEEDRRSVTAAFHREACLHLSRRPVFLITAQRLTSPNLWREKQSVLFGWVLDLRAQTTYQVGWQVGNKITCLDTSVHPALLASSVLTRNRRLAHRARRC